jgi:transcriptional regulator with GAF, ATPase, and Fis domain
MGEALDVGDVVASRYRVVRVLGSGGAGTAYLVDDGLRDAEVALKLLDSEGRDDEAIRGELQLLRGLVHPNLARMRDYGRLGDGRLFYTADYLAQAGLTADDPWPALARVLIGPLEALRWLHAVGIRHGDVKPDNVLARGGEGVLIDFSCAARFGPRAQPSGTPGFMAPELLAGEHADGHADRFSVGATIAWLAERCAVPPAVARIGQRCRDHDAASRPDLADVIAALGAEPAPLATPFVQPPTLLGRRMAVETITQFLAQGAERELIIAGPDGSGKTRILEEAKWLAGDRQASAEQREDHQGIHEQTIDGHGTRSDGLIEMLRRAADDPALVDDPSAVLRIERPTLLLIDDVDGVVPSQQRLLEAIRRSANIRLIATRHEVDGADLPLEPLSPEDVARWIGDRLSPERSTQIHRLTGGYPGALAELMGRLGWRDWGAEDLDQLADEQGANDARFEAQLAELDPQVHAALATFAACRLPLDAERLTELTIDARPIAELARRGLIVAGADGWRLARRTQSVAVLERLDAARRDALHARLAQVLEHHDPVEAARQSLAAGLSAERWLRGAPARDQPDAWVNVARDAMRRDPSPSLAEAAAGILERSGRADEALSAIARTLRSASNRPLMRRLAAAAYLRAGDLDRAMRMVRRAVDHLEGMDQARALDLASRIHLKRGEWSLAIANAERGLAQCERPSQRNDEGLRADLHDDLGVAASYCGDFAIARKHLASAAQLHGAAGRERAQARSASYRALADYRAGQMTAADAGYREALRLAERCGAADLIVYAAQNLGAVTHQRGDLAAAATSYERGLAMATALNDRATEATLRCNLAKLLSDVGLFERALELATRAEALATQAGLALIAATAKSIRGEVALWRGDNEAAIEAFEAARAGFGEDASRELVETDLHLASALRHEPERAQRLVERARQGIAELDGVDDLAARLALVSAKIELDAGAHAEAIERLEGAVGAAQRSEQRELEAECHAVLALACERHGANSLASEHRQAARRLWERCALTLPPERAQSYWRHPLRASVPSAAVPSPQVPAQATSREQQLARLLGINKKLGSTLDAVTILTLAIDSALELTGAERGFVILSREDGSLELATARNIDPTKSDDGARFSHSIAQRVIAQGEPVITLDAQADARFETQKSVHAMRLKSVVGVPIIAPAGVIGALYLDHRFRRGIFGPEQVELLGAFADQVAIALTNARLHQQLAERSRELDRLNRGQAERIEDLTERVRVQQQVLETRYDYRNIVGSSPAMQQVFRLLDRVIASDVPVLVQGESGTGKELIAKAIHYNGERKDGPLVTLNCGALPLNLLESELFGYRRGAFTGASEDRDGLFVAARGGTLFLDEVGEMPAAMQVKLLRVIQEREVTPLGTAQSTPIDVRLVAASNRSLRDEVDAGRFREDLYYRLGVVEVWVPPLRERPSDIPLIVAALIDQAAERLGRPAPEVSPEAMRALMEHRWGGNVRELENVVTKSLLLAEGDVIERAELGLATRGPVRAKTRTEHDEAEGERLLETLRATSWNISETARRLAVSRPTVYRWMKRHGFDEA